MTKQPPPESAKEWGRRQAAAAPPWSEAQWRRVCLILGDKLVRLTNEEDEERSTANTAD